MRLLAPSLLIMAKDKLLIFPMLFFKNCHATLVVEVADGNGLDVLVLSHSIQTALLSVTALLDTTEGSLGSADLSSVGTDHTDLHLVGNAHNTADILGEEVSGQTELGVVG